MKRSVVVRNGVSWSDGDTADCEQPIVTDLPVSGAWENDPWGPAESASLGVNAARIASDIRSGFNSVPLAGLQA